MQPVASHLKTILKPSRATFSELPLALKLLKSWLLALTL
jgi:hypothetical protein